MKSRKLREAYLCASEHPHKPEGKLYNIQLACGVYLEDYVLNESAAIYRVSTKRQIGGSISKGSNYTNVNIYVPDGDRNKRRTYKLHSIMGSTFFREYNPVTEHIHHADTSLDQVGRLNNSLSNLSIEDAGFNSMNTAKHRASRIGALKSMILMPIVLLIFSLSMNSELRGIQIGEYIEQTFSVITNKHKRIRFEDIGYLFSQTKEELAHYLSSVGHDVSLEDINEWLDSHKIEREKSKLNEPDDEPKRIT